MKFSLRTLFFGVAILSILLAVNVHFARKGVFIDGDRMYDYSQGWPVPYQSGPAPRPPSVWPDGTIFHHASGLNSICHTARSQNVVVGLVVVGISCLGFNWVHLRRGNAN